VVPVKTNTIQSSRPLLRVDSFVVELALGPLPFVPLPVGVDEQATAIKLAFVKLAFIVASVCASHSENGFGLLVDGALAALCPCEPVSIVDIAALVEVGAGPVPLAIDELPFVAVSVGVDFDAQTLKLSVLVKVAKERRAIALKDHGAAIDSLLQGPADENLLLAVLGCHLDSFALSS